MKEMKRTMTIDLDKSTISSSIKGVITAVFIMAYVIGRNIHRMVIRHPWAVIAVITVVYSLLSLLLYVNCTSRQRAAEEQRDSMLYEYDRVTNQTAYRLGR